jgi:serine/threonine-protein kinase
MPHSLGRYILERTLAHGGMGEVHLARQTGPDGYDRVCCVKTMHANLTDDPDLVEMFLEEARLTAKLTHAHIAQIYDFGKIDAAYYIAMELVDGPSLHTVIKSYAMRREPVPLGPAIRMVSQAAQALDYVHRLKGPDGLPLNLIHRDISPGNLLLSKEGMVKLVDFGIAKARTTARQTKMGQVRGKLAYMSPEQILGLPLDGRTDIYSLGLVLFELLALKRAMQGKNEVEILASVRNAALEPLTAVRPDASPRLAEALERAVTRDREQRFQRAADFSQALEQVLIEMGHAVGPDALTAIAEDVMQPQNAPRSSPAPNFAPKLPSSDRSAETKSSPALPRASPAPPPRSSPRERTFTHAGVAAPPSPSAIPPPRSSPREAAFTTPAAAPGQPSPVPSRPEAPTQFAGGMRPAPSPPSVSAHRAAPPSQKSRARWIGVGALALVVGGAAVAVLMRAPPTPNKTVVAAAPPPPPKPPPIVAAPPLPEPAPEPVRTVEPAPLPPAPELPSPETPPVPPRLAHGVPRVQPPRKVAPGTPSASGTKLTDDAPASAATGTLNVRTEPPMEILVDGNAQGIAPKSLALAPGAHEVTLREPRLRLEHRQSVTLTVGSSADVSWKPTKGLLDVRAVPPDVELQITVDGETVGATPLPEISVWEGARRLTAVNKATGWRAEQRIDVPAGGKLRVKVKDGAGMEVTAR